MDELYSLVKDFDPSDIGVAFDIGHALVVHGPEWARYFERLKLHVRVVYIKDVRQGGGWVRFGEGLIGSTDYFKRLKKMEYREPICLHIEYDYGRGDGSRKHLLAALKQSTQQVREWWAKA